MSNTTIDEPYRVRHRAGKKRLILGGGIQFSGKSKHLKTFANTHDFSFVDMGVEFRQIISVGKSALAREVRAYIDKGNLVPDELTFNTLFPLLEGRLRYSEVVCVVGYPRNCKQAELLFKHFSALTCMAYFDVSPEESSRRREAELQKGKDSERGIREDDLDTEAFKKRLAISKRNGEILLERLPRMNCPVFKIDTHGPFDEVHANLNSILQGFVPVLKKPPVLPRPFFQSGVSAGNLVSASI